MIARCTTDEFRDVAAICIIYMLPSEEVIKNWTWMAAKGAYVVLLDNTPGRLAGTKRTGNLIYYCMGRNSGMAAALNKGVEICRQLSARYIFTFDQDSSFDINFIRAMLTEYKLQRQTFAGPLALGPYPINMLTGASYLRRSDRLRLWVQKYLLRQSEHRLLPVRELITSGLLADDETYSSVGNYQNELFIDFVDHEWTWRLARRGGRCIVVMDVKMAHMIGSGDIPYTGGMRLGSPTRILYLFRNGIFLALTGKMPFYDAIKFIFLVPVKFLVFGLLRDRKLRWKNLYLGLKAGIGAALRGQVQ